jgi:hypothetical protein
MALCAGGGAVAPEYLRLSRDCGWTDTRYADLIARTLQATLGAH